MLFFKILLLLIGHVKNDVTLFLFILSLVGRKQFPMFNGYFLVFLWGFFWGGVNFLFVSLTYFSVGIFILSY